MRISRADDIFLKKFEELSNLISQFSEYNLLKMSGILRHFLLDKTPLIHKVNQTWHFKPIYKIYNPPFEDLEDKNLVLWTRPNGLYPDEGSDPDYIFDVKLDKLLSTKISKLGFQFVTVKDVIKYAANILGAVHLRDPNPDKQEEFALDELRKFVNISGINLPLYQLHSLSKIILYALKPLYEHIKSVRAQGVLEKSSKKN